MDTLRVLYFGLLRERRGCVEQQVPLDAPVPVAALYARLFAGTPEAALPVAFAINATYVAGDAIAAPGDEVAFLPPVGGG
ncbi:MAG: MoaD/ThiS family protein [Alphaproteobacteria bacterium]|nr:MoaD/ThiS family protein [Alphaproteobacteria bacterium]